MKNYCNSKELREGYLFYAPLFWDKNSDTAWKTVSYYKNGYVKYVNEKTDEDIIKKARKMVRHKELFEKQLRVKSFTIAKGYFFNGYMRPFKKIGKL